MPLKILTKYVGILGLLLIIIGVIYIFEDKIDNIYKNFVYKDENYKVKDKNEYYRYYNFEYVKNVDTYIAHNEKDIRDIYYTGLNTGADFFEFKCSTEYENCLNDVEKLANNNAKLSDINNFVHPYNSFKNINTTYNNLGIVTVEITHMYSQEDIEAINTKISAIYPTLTQGLRIDDENSIKNVITTIHNYIIETTKYDTERADNNVIKYKSDIAYGPLFEGYALCGGYTDLVELMLENMGIESYRISANRHIWNAINIRGKWYNLDLTWDDPVTNTGQQVVLTEYLLIDSNTMLSKDKSQHLFDPEVYIEMKST